MKQLMTLIEGISINELKDFLSSVDHDDTQTPDNIQAILDKLKDIYQTSQLTATAEKKPITDIISESAQREIDLYPLDTLLKINLLAECIIKLYDKDEKKVTAGVYDALKLNENEYGRLKSKFEKDDNSNIYEIVEGEAHDKTDDGNFDIFGNGSRIITPDEYKKIKKAVEANDEYMHFRQTQLAIVQATDSLRNDYAPYELVRFNAGFAVKAKIVASDTADLFISILEKIISDENVSNKHKFFINKILLSYSFVEAKDIQSIFQTLFDYEDFKEFGFWYDLLFSYLTEVTSEDSQILKNLQANKPESLEDVFATENLANITPEYLALKCPKISKTPYFNEFYFDYVIKNIPQIYQQQMKLHEDDIFAAVSSKIKDVSPDYIKELIKFEHDCNMDDDIHLAQRKVLHKEYKKSYLEHGKQETKESHPGWQKKFDKAIKRADDKVKVKQDERNEKIEPKLDHYPDLKRMKEAAPAQFYEHYEIVNRARLAQANLAAKEFITHLQNHIFHTNWGDKIGYKEIKFPGGSKKVPAHVAEIFKECVNANKDGKYVDHMNRIAYIGKEASKKKPKFLFFSLTRTEQTQKFYDSIKESTKQSKVLRKEMLGKLPGRKP